MTQPKSLYSVYGFGLFTGRTDKADAYAPTQGRIQDFWIGGSYLLHNYVGVRFADFISFFLNIT